MAHGTCKTWRRCKKVLKKAAIEVDRKVLADIVVHYKTVFGQLVEKAKAALA
ncbi:ribosomal protein L20 [Endozoicomonas sp. NE40]|uniref:Ribosomal protein L20 n=1 Tax=Endozoicomonas lisbonensis TaxID=3120522 RepID=A0ABV2SLY6_9GAMM